MASQHANHVYFVEILAVHVEAGGLGTPGLEAGAFIDALSGGATDADAEAETVDAGPGAGDEFCVLDDREGEALASVRGRDVDAVDVGAVAGFDGAVAHEFRTADECGCGGGIVKCADQCVAAVGFAVADVAGDSIGVEACVVLRACAESPGCVGEHFVAEGDVERGVVGCKRTDWHAE